MLRRFGQAAGHSFRLLRVLVALGLGLAALAAVAAGFLAWRLSKGPIDLPWAVQRLEQAVNTPGAGTRLVIGNAALAWEGFRSGVQAPVDIRVSDTQVVGADGVTLAALPRAQVTLSVGALLLGRVVPRTVELDGPRLRLLREPDGQVLLDLGGLAGGPPAQAATAPAAPLATVPAAPPDAASGAPLDRVLADLATPPHAGGTAVAGPLQLGELREVLIRDAEVEVVDRSAGVFWHAPSARIDLHRSPSGELQGTAEASLALGQVQARLDLRAEMAPGAAQTQIAATLSPVTPAALAQAAPILAPVAPVKVPVGLAANLALGSRLQPTHFTLVAQAGPGEVSFGTGTVGLEGGVLALDGTPERVALRGLRLQLRSLTPGRPGPTLTAEGTATHADGRLRASLTVGVDRVSMTELPRLWPEGVGGGARPWVTGNITTGTAHDGRLTLGFESADDLSGLRLTALSGQVLGDGLTVHWLRPVPPLEHVALRLTVENPDALAIEVLAGQQGAIALQGGGIRITGLSGPDQAGDIDLQIGGPLAAAVTLLRHRRLHLLDHAPVPIRDPAGSFAAHVRLHLPFVEDLDFDRIALHTTAKLADVHLSGIAAGRDLDKGALDLDVTNAGLKVNGDARVAGIPVALQVGVDFTGHAPDGVTTRAAVQGNADARQLAAAGFDTLGLLSGPAALDVTYTDRRDGTAAIVVAAGLTGATLDAGWLGWKKPAGQKASASARLVLGKGEIQSAEDLQATGPGLSLQGRASFAGGRPTLLHLDRAVIGQTDAHGDIGFPAQPKGALRIDAAGRQADLSGLISRQGPDRKKEAEKKEAEKPGPPWSVTARFQRVLLAKGHGLGPVVASVESDGRVVQRAEVQTGAPESIRASIAPAGTGRRLSITAADAGALLSALDLIHSIRGGTTTISGLFDDRVAGHPLSGTAEIDGARMVEVPAAVKVLQGMSLYGLVDALRGPGLDITRLIAPFSLDGDVLRLGGVRAYNASIGATVKGAINVASGAADLQGTIVPVYALNSFLGRLPLIGGLFSPEKGGGVFAATYHVYGQLADPTVTVNPLAALTPGFLRGIFGVFRPAAH